MSVPTIETWDRDEIINTLTAVVREQLGLSFAEFVQMARLGKVDPCEHAELIALLNFLPSDDPLFTSGTAA